MQQAAAENDGTRELPLVVAETERTRPSEEFGRRALELARDAGITTKDLAKAVGKSLASIERLQRGQGSMEVGIRVRNHLVRRKVDVSSLPPLVGEAIEEPQPQSDEWEEEWLRVGRLLREHAKPEWWNLEFSKLKRMADAYEVQARELDEASRAT